MRGALAGGRIELAVVPEQGVQDVKRATVRIVPALLLLAGIAASQITVANGASGATNPFTQVTGSAISINTVNQRIGVGCGDRENLATASSSFIPCGGGINPNNGFTIQFWLWCNLGQQASGNPDYLFGDNTMVAPAAAGASGGAFRCFLNGAAGAGALLFRGVSNQ